MNDRVVTNVDRKIFQQIDTRMNVAKNATEIHYSSKIATYVPNYVYAYTDWQCG